MNFPFELKAETKFDVVGFGTNAVDHLIRTPQYPEFGSKIEITERFELAGGEVASTLAGLARLGMSTAYAGRFGSDREGEMGLQSLRDEGVDVVYAEIIDRARTQCAYIVIDEASGERTILWQRDARLAYKPEDAPIEAARECRVLHMTPHDTAACIRMAEAARANGGVVSIDIDNTFPGIEELLPLVDVCIASADLPQKLVGQADPQNALGEMAGRFGCRVTGITLGREGSLVYCDGSFFSSPGFPVPGGCQDTTGAGDAFRTGLLFGILKGRSIEESCVAANAVAALKCRGVGARSALPDRTELDEMIRRAKQRA